MTSSPALIHFVVAATSSKSSNPLLTLLPLVAIGVLGYFFFIKPQQRKAKAARESQGRGSRSGTRCRRSVASSAPCSRSTATVTPS